VNKGFTRRIVELTKDESDVILDYLFKVSLLRFRSRRTHQLTFFQLIAQNHDNQVRFKWRQNDVAIWDNRTNYHTATYDYEDTRIGDRVVALGEAPYYDERSTSRRTALAKEHSATFQYDDQTLEKSLPTREVGTAGDSLQK